MEIKNINQDIAIVGIACRFPDADNKEEFWNNLKNAISSIKEIPSDRWNKELFYSEVNEKGKMNTISGGFLDRVDSFDANFFNISEKEAESIDPQQRLLLEVVYEAIEDSGYKPESLRGEKIGVFIGISSSDYSHIYLKNPEQIDMYSISGSAQSVASNRLSYIFDLKGASISIDTACSSSLVAIHSACQSIKLNESKMAIVGGVNLILSPLITIGFSQAQATSPDGKCRAFDADANGMVRGEGCGIVILKPLSEAIKDNDNIYAVIKGSAVNQDGQTNGLLAPSSQGQKEVLFSAYQNANINPKNIDFIETHGTGTILGDPIEAKALGEIVNINREIPCKIGSVKTNIGHLEASAGIAGLIKTVLCLKNKSLVPSLNYNKPNPYIPFDEWGLSVQTKLENIKKDKIIAGVSSFGFGGTNAHIVLESFNSDYKSNEIINNEKIRPFILPLSAQSEKSLIELSENLKKYTEEDLNNLSYTASLKRQFYNYRSSFIFSSRQELEKQLDDFDNEKTYYVPKRKPKLCFVFSGMGSQQIGMGRELLNEPIFLEIITKCDSLMKKYHDWSIIDEIKNNEEQKIERVQPTLFAIQIGIFELLKYFGIKPDTLIGSSVGEIAMAYCSGILSLEDAIKVICLRNFSMIKMIGKGAMAIVQIPDIEIKEILKNYNNIWVSALNSPTMTVLSGKEEQLEKLIKELKEKDVFCRLIKGAVAPSHCELMEPIKNDILNDLFDIKANKSNIDIFSTVTGKKETGENFNNEYWWNNIKSPINFYPTINEIEKKSNHIYIEISPHPVLNGFIKETLIKNDKKTYTLASLRKDDKEQFYKTIGDLFSLGFDIDWDKLYPNGKMTSFPHYTWQRERYWLSLPENTSFDLGQIESKSINAKEPEKDNRSIKELLQESNQNNKLDILNNYLRFHVAKVLKVKLDEVDINQPLKNLGIGSLMGMELFNKLKSDLDISIPVSKFLKGPSIQEISNEIIKVNNESNNKLIDKKTIKLIKNIENESYPLSFSQQRLWFIEKFEKDIFAYNIPAVLKLEGELNIDILEKSINKIVERHEVLRTNFKTINNQSSQVIYDKKFIPIKFVDLSDNQDKFNLVNSLMLEDTCEKFDLEKSNLLRVSTYKLDEKVFLVLLTIHHIIADGLSLKIIFNEIRIIYEALINNQEPELEDLKIQYKDYAKWQIEQFENGVYNKQIEYWQDQLKDIPKIINLPLDKKRPEIQTFNGAMQSFILDEQLFLELQNLSKKLGVTLFTLLLSAFKLLLSRYSNQDDIVIGTPIAGRNEPELLNMVGIFLNMLAIRDKINFENSFSEFAKKVSETTLSAYDNQDLPFDKIVEILKPERDMSHTPIFQVIMALHASIEIDSFSDMKVSSLDIDMKTSKFDLTLAFIPEKEGFKGNFEYNTDLFNHETIESLKNSYLNILETIVKNDEIKLKEISLFSDNDLSLHIIKHCVGELTEIEESSVLYLINYHFINNPDIVAIKEKDRYISYKELDLESNKIANALKDFDDNIIAVFLDKSIDFIISILGVLKSGKAYLPLNINSPLDRNLYILDNSNCKTIISNKKYHEKEMYKSNKLNSNILYIEDLKENSNTHLNIEIKHDNNAYIIYTSGSTGKPKGVQINHKNLLNLVKWHNRVYIDPIGNNTALIANLSFDASVWEIFANLSAGLTINIPQNEILESTSKLLDWLKETKINTIFLPTPLLELVINKDFSDNQYLKRVLTGGDKLSILSKNKLPFKIYNHYGPTECTVVSTFCEITDSSIPIGKAIDNLSIFILDKYLNLCPMGVVGEICIGGLSLSKGYFNDNELTNKKFIDTKFGKLYKSGDLGKLRNDGNIEFLGREDNQVKIRGIRIELQEIEETIRSFKNISNVYITTIGEKNNKKIIAFIIGDKEKELKEYLNNKLNSEMIPSLVYLDSFPINSNGKIDINKLNDIYHKNYIQEENQSFDNKSNNINIKNKLKNSNINDLIDIWKKVLKLNNIDINSNFFELGGHSLIAIELIDSIIEYYQVDISLKELFSYPTISKLYNLIKEKQLNNIDSFIFPKVIHDSNINQAFTLTDVQQAYWVGRTNNIDMGNISAHAYLEIDIKKLDINKFESALNTLIERHPMLRTIILENGTQKILESNTYYKILVNDLKNNPKELEIIRDKLSHEILDSTKFPLFRISVSLLDEFTSRIHISIDGLIADALSMNILARELSLLYLNQDFKLSELEINFRDYILTEKKLHNSILYQKSKDYWKNRLENFPNAPQLPINDITSLTNPKFNRLSYKLDSKKWDILKNKASKINISNSVLLLSIFSQVLSLWSKNKNFIINLTLFNRLPLHSQVKDIVGDFTSLNLLEVNINNESFESICLKIQEQLWQDIDNKYIGGIWVLRELAKLRGLENSLMPIVFTSLLSQEEIIKDYNNFNNPLFDNIVYSITQTPQVWLDHQVSEVKGDLIFNWDYLEQVFPENLIKNIFNTYCLVLNYLSLDDELWNKNNIVYTVLHKNINISNNELIEFKEASNFINKIIEINNTDESISNKFLHELFFDQVNINPNQNAIITQDLTISYEQLAKMVTYTFNNIKNFNNNSSTPLVAVIMEKGWEQIVAVLSILKSGCAYLPINPEHPKDRIDYLLSICDVKLAITQEKWLNNIDIDKNIKLISIDNDLIDESKNTDIDYTNTLNNSINDLAYIIFTSGSTGLPKGVMIDHQGAVNTILDINKRFKINSVDKVFAISSLNFDLSVYDIFGALSAGATIVLPKPDWSRDIEHWVDLINKNNVTVWNSVPPLMKMLVEYVKGKEDKYPKSLKKVLLSGDWIPTDLPEQIRLFNPNINIYSLGGATEASIWSIFYPIEKVDSNFVSIPYGKPLTNQKIFILDENLDFCPEYVVGEIYIGGIGLAKGYFKDIEKTNNSFIEISEENQKYLKSKRLYKTGDLGKYLSDGNIEFLGRKDSQVKIQGHRIELGELESILNQNENIENAIVIAFDKNIDSNNNSKSDKYLVAFIKYKGKNLTDTELNDYMQLKLPCYMIPSIFITVDNFHLNSNGKIDRNSLKIPNNKIEKDSNISINQEYITKISKMAQEVLSIEYISPDTDLLSLGANSIDIVKLANLLEQEFGFCPKMGDIFQLKTINKLAVFYEVNKSKIKSKENVSISKIIFDPEKRELFKNSHKNIRSFNTESIDLEINDKDDYLFNNYHSTRTFSDDKISFKQLSNLLNSLRHKYNNNYYKAQYASAGSLYPVQIYIHLKEDIEHLREGIYYYNPQKHRLNRLSSAISLNKELHFYINQSIYEKSQFSIYLISDLKAIEPIYANSSIEYSLIEAGSISQILRMRAEENDLGLCQIGQIDFEKIKSLLQLDDKYILLHIILGGYKNKDLEHEKFSFLDKEDLNEDEWEEFTI
ncbi:MAG: amino acid adenylation domain-containing protein [Candidatus Sericytochromatia bacterium]